EERVQGGLWTELFRVFRDRTKSRPGSTCNTWYWPSVTQAIWSYPAHSAARAAHDARRMGSRHPDFQRRSIEPFAHMPGYAATKAAVNNLRASLCQAVAGSCDRQLGD